MLRKRTRTRALLVVLVAGTLAFGLAHAVSVAGQATPVAQAEIESAMAAGPSSITEHATIMGNETDAEGNPVVLRDGSNDWTCFPDAPGTPGRDPMCLDKTSMGWLKAIIAHKEPNTQVAGLMYMLAGGSDASNTDPYASGPEAGNEWITSPAHVMIILPGKLDQSIFSTDPLSGGPFIMWAGTPYEHLMVPVDPHGMVEMGDMSGMGQATPPA